jgi:nucleoside 2-deoxyribosyltransferase
MARVYCAGPLFNPPERNEMLEIATQLERAGYETFLPQRDGLELAELQSIIAELAEPRTASDVLHRAIFSFDVFKLLSWSDGVVANFNGRVPDEGTVVEAALAWHAGKALVIYKNDSRAAFAGRDNPMLTGLTDGQFVNDAAEIVGLLEAQLAERRDARLQHTLEIGNRISALRAQTEDVKAIAMSLLKITTGKHP